MVKEDESQKGNRKEDGVEIEKKNLGDGSEEPESDLPNFVQDDKELAENFKNHVKDRMKERDDLFDEMVVHEEQIRLGDSGWKARYYEVSTWIMPLLGMSW